MPDAAVTSFAVVFTLFAVVTVILLVLVLRFTLQRAAVARARWLAEQSGEQEAIGEDDGEDERELTALVLAGGGTRGAVQIGMLQVLTEHGFTPDRIYGSSVGAVNGVVFAADPTRRGVERMTEIWRGLNRDDIYPQGRLHGPWLYVQQRDSVYPNTGLRKVIEDGSRLRTARGRRHPGRGGGHLLDRWPGAMVHLRIGHGRRAGVDGRPGDLPARGDRW